MAAAIATGTALGVSACTNDQPSPAAKPSQKTPSSAKDAAKGASDSGKDPLESITVKTPVGKEPALEFATPLTFQGLYSKVTTPGTGAAIKEGDVVITRSAYFDPSTGRMLASQWQTKGVNSMPVSKDTIGPKATEFFKKANVGSRFLMAGESSDGPVIQAGDIVGVALKRAEGTPKPLPSSLPAFTLGKDGSPTLKGKPSRPAPTEQTVAVSIEGTGPAAKAGDTLVMHYRGWNWATGEEFDSSWKHGEPFTFTLGKGEVIKGWDTGLVGKKQGSQVVLALPPKVAYGESGGSELSGQTLLFVADVLYVASL